VGRASKDNPQENTMVEKKTVGERKKENYPQLNDNYGERRVCALNLLEEQRSTGQVNGSSA